jgi:hypothetical protein
MMKIRRIETRVELLQLIAAGIVEAREIGYTIYKQDDLAMSVLRKLQEHPRLKVVLKKGGK